MSFISPDNYELGLITKDITDKTTYYAKDEGNVIKIYKTAPASASAAASVAPAKSLYDLVTDDITGYKMGTDPTPVDAVPFYVITENIGEEYNISDNPHMYVLPSLSIEQFETKVGAEKQRLAAEAKEEADRLAKEEADKLERERAAAEEEEEKRKQDAAAAAAAAAAAEEEKRKQDAAAAAAEEEKRKQDAAAAAAAAEEEKRKQDAAAASTATTSKPQRRGFPNFGSSCWALSIIYLFYDTTDFREHILSYIIQNIPEIFTMDIKNYIGLKSGEMLTQYHIDKLKSDNNEMFKKMNPLFNTTDGIHKDIPNIQSVWGFHIFRDEVLKIIDNISITDKKSAIETLYASLLAESNIEEKQFKDKIKEIKEIKDNVTQMNEIFIYAFQILFNYTSGEDFVLDTVIKSLFVIPLIIFGDFGQRDNTEFITKLAQLCEISIDLSTYNTKSKEERTFYVKDPGNDNNYLGDLIGIKKYFRIIQQENIYYYDGNNCTDKILSTKESFNYSISLGVASEYKENDSIDTYLDKSNPLSNGSFYLPDELDFLKNNSSLNKEDYNEIEKIYISQINKLNDKKWEILKAKFNIPNNVRKLDVELDEGTLKINRIMTDFTKFKNWLKTQSINVPIPTVRVNDNVQFNFVSNGDKWSGVVTKIDNDIYTIKYNTLQGDIEAEINKTQLILPTTNTLWNNANADYKRYEAVASTNQCQKSNTQNFVTGKYLCVSLMRKDGERGPLIETKINLNDTIMVDSKQYKLIGATIYQGGHYYYDSIRDNLKLNDDAVNELDINEKNYITTHWSTALYEHIDVINASTSARAGGSRKTFRVSRRKKVRPL